MKTLADHMGKLRSSRGLSLRGVSDKTGGRLSRHAVYKAERGKPVKARTLAVILGRGYGLKESDHAYIEAFALWSADQAKTITAPDMALAVASMHGRQDAKFAVFARQLLKLAHRLPDSDRPAVLKAVANAPALRLWMASRR